VEIRKEREREERRMGEKEREWRVLSSLGIYTTDKISQNMQ
jgi:hypothetical protein